MFLGSILVNQPTVHREGGSVAVAVGVGGYFGWVLMLLSAHVKRFSVSRMQDFI